MKATILSTLFAIVYALNVSAQDTFPPGSEGNSELKINMLYLVFEIVEMEYERILTPDVSVGLAANYWLSNTENMNYTLLPYFRLYPAHKLRASGFFVEANMAVLGYDQMIVAERNGVLSVQEEPQVRFGGGFALGGKFVANSGLFCEVSAGVGRVAGKDRLIYEYPRLAISIGKRF